MDFGRLPNVDHVDFTLPPQDPANRQTCAAFQRTDAAPQVLFGSPQWGHEGYVGRIYPEGTRRQDYLLHYARQFPAVELNSTFYGIRPGLITRWADATPEGFRFCPKVPRTISHDLGLVDAGQDTAAFVQNIDAFGSRLGLAWMLLPESFGPTQARTLVEFLRAWPQHVPLAVELRHRDWFRDRKILNAVLGVFEQTGTSPVMTDVAGRRDVLHQRLTTPTVVLRFVGNSLHPSDFTRIAAWVERFRDWFAQGVHTVYVFLHQPSEEQNLELAECFGEQLQRTCSLHVQVPRRIERFEQGQLF